MKTTQERLSEVYSRLSDENAESEKQQLRGAAIAAGCYGGVYFVHSYCGGLPKPSEYTFHISEVNGSIRGVAGQYFEGELKDRGKTEVQFSHFIDLLNDSIVPWRLVEDGFTSVSIALDGGSTTYGMNIETKSSAIAVTFQNDDLFQVVRVSQFHGHKLEIGKIRLDGITTYTDLLTQIRLIG
jgi:hypothetical protein